MKPTEYRRLRESVGDVGLVAALLDVNVRTIERREKGTYQVGNEAALAIRALATLKAEVPKYRVRVSRKRRK